LKARLRSDRRVGEEEDRSRERRQETWLDRLAPPGDETTARELDEEDQREAAEEEDEQEEPVDPIDEPRPAGEARFRHALDGRSARVRHQIASKLLGRALIRWK
jgi:hypothetical protein